MTLFERGGYQRVMVKRDDGTMREWRVHNGDVGTIRDPRVTMPDRCYSTRTDLTRLVEGLTKAAERHTEWERERERPLVEATVRARHPESYVLVNEDDGTRWRIGPDGSWMHDE